MHDIKFQDNLEISSPQTSANTGPAASTNTEKALDDDHPRTAAVITGVY